MEIARSDRPKCAWVANDRDRVMRKMRRGESGSSERFCRGAVSIQRLAQSWNGLLSFAFRYGFCRMVISIFCPTSGSGAVGFIFSFAFGGGMVMTHGSS